MKYYADFESNCPFSLYYIATRSTEKFWLRTIKHICAAAQVYNRMCDYIIDYNKYTLSPKAIEFVRVDIFDEQNDRGEIAQVFFSRYDKSEEFVVAILEEEE